MSHFQWQTNHLLTRVLHPLTLLPNVSLLCPCHCQFPQAQNWRTLCFLLETPCLFQRHTSIKFQNQVKWTVHLHQPVQGESSKVGWVTELLWMNITLVLLDSNRCSLPVMRILLLNIVIYGVQICYIRDQASLSQAVHYQRQMVWDPKWLWLFNAIALINQHSLRYLINHCSNNLRENCIMNIVANPKTDSEAKRKWPTPLGVTREYWNFEMNYEPQEVASRWPYKQMKNGITPLLPARPQRLSLTNSSVPMMWGKFGRWVASGPCLEKTVYVNL